MRTQVVFICKQRSNEEASQPQQDSALDHMGEDLFYQLVSIGLHHGLHIAIWSLIGIK